MYKIYVFSYETGWELINITKRENQIEEILDKVSGYKQYIVIKKTDRDEIYKVGRFIETNKSKRR